MSGEIISEILITSDVQGLHGVSLNAENILLIEMIALGVGEISNGTADVELSVELVSEGISGNQGGVDITFEVAADVDGLSGFLADINGQFNPLGAIQGGSGAGGSSDNEIDIDVSSEGISGYDITISADIPLEIECTGSHSLGLNISSEIEIGIFSLGLHGYGSNTVGVVDIRSNSRGGAYTDIDEAPRFGQIHHSVEIDCVSEGYLVNSIVSDVTIICESEGAFIPPLFVVITAQIFGQGGDFLRDGFIGEYVTGLPISIQSNIRGVYGFIHLGTVNTPIIITPSINGFMLPRGDINSVIPIAANIQGTSTTFNSLFGLVSIESNSFGVSGIADGDIASDIIISPSLIGSTDFRRASISATIEITPSIQGAQALIGFLENEVIISGANTNRARSFLPNGEQVPLSFVHGFIDNTIEIQCTALSDDATLFGQIEASFEILADINTNRGQVIGRSGDIEATIIIEGFLSEALTGVTVSKISNEAVVYDFENGIGIAKIATATVTAQPNNGIIIGKAVAYAVIAPPDEDVAPTGYEAILFF